MSDLEQALIAYSEKRADMNQVMRALLTHRGWFVSAGLFALNGEPTRKVNSMLVLSNENLIPSDQLWIFTDEGAARLATSRGASLGTYAGGMAGTELFQIIDPSFQTVYVNPGSPVERTWVFQEGSACTVGKLWAEAIALEEKFEQWQQAGQPDRAMLESHRGFLVFDHVSGPIITLPNQGGMSNPAAVFTAPDCVEKFLSALGEEERNSVRQVEVDGKRLLELPSVCGLDGLPFNFFGPGVSYAC